MVGYSVVNLRRGRLLGKFFLASTRALFRGGWLLGFYYEERSDGYSGSSQRSSTLLCGEVGYSVLASTMRRGRLLGLSSEEVGYSVVNLRRGRLIGRTNTRAVLRGGWLLGAFSYLVLGLSTDERDRVLGLTTNTLSGPVKI